MNPSARERIADWKRPVPRQQQQQTIACATKLTGTLLQQPCRDVKPRGGSKLEDNRAGGFMNKDELNGKFDRLKGQAKQAVGDATDNETLHDEGVADEAAGNVEEGFGKTRRKVGDAIHDVAHKIKD